MVGFHPYETFQSLIETGGIDRTNTLLCAACDAYCAPRQAQLRPRWSSSPLLAHRLFPSAAPVARAKAAATLGRAEALTPELEDLVIANLGEDLVDFLSAAPRLSEVTMLKLLAQGDVSDRVGHRAPADMTNVVLAKLFQLNSRKVYRALASNTGDCTAGPYLSALARSAQMDHQVAWSLAARDDFDKRPPRSGLLRSRRERPHPGDRRLFAQRNTPARADQEDARAAFGRDVRADRALMKLFSENRRPEVTRLLNQITGLDEVRCGQISHDTSGAALFVVLRAFGCNSQDGLKVLIHATSHDKDRSRSPSVSSRSSSTRVSVDAMAYLMSSWRGEVNLLDLGKPEYRPFTVESRRTPIAVGYTRDPVVERTIEALANSNARQQAS